VRSIGIVTVASHGPYGFSYVAQELSHTLKIPLVELIDKTDYLKLLLARPNFIIYVGTLPPKKLLAFSMVSKRIIAYLVVEGPFPIPKYLKWLANNTNRFLVVTPSNYVKNELLPFGLKVRKIIPHGISLSKIRHVDLRIKLPLDKIKVLTVASSLQYRKRLGFLYILHTWSKLPLNVRKNGFLILKVPKGSSGYIRELTKSLGFKNNEHIILDYTLTRDEMFTLYGISDLYIHPSLSDGFGLPIIESLACGTPVMVMNSGPWNEIVTKEVGWLVKVSRETIVKEDNLPYRIRIPDTNDLYIKLANALEYCKEYYEILRKKCIEYARVFDAGKVYGRFKELLEDSHWQEIFRG
jgi:glycosyltransferase involved in cell wall biosynthesis